MEAPASPRAIKRPILPLPAAATAALLFGVAVLAAGCSNSAKKLNTGRVDDFFLYDLPQRDRDPSYYYELVENSHDQACEDWSYRPSEDQYVVDKNVDAVTKLGRASFSRIEGQAQAALQLCTVLLEDQASLARVHAGNSVTKIAARLPRYPRAQWAASTEERGDTFLAVLRELDGMHDPQGRCVQQGAWVGQRQVDLIGQLGEFNIVDPDVARDAVKPFLSRPYLINAQDARIRQARDVALAKRTDQMIRVSLQAALEDTHPHVRRQAIIGLKTLSDRPAEPAVLARLQTEADWQVQAEGAEYLGKMASAEAVGALLPMLEGPDPTLRHKARQGLIRAAGRDYGRTRDAWERWATSRYPLLAQRRAEAERLEREAEEKKRRDEERRRRRARGEDEPAPDEGEGTTLPPAPGGGTTLPPAPGPGTTLPPAPDPTLPAAPTTVPGLPPAPSLPPAPVPQVP